MIQRLSFKATNGLAMCRSTREHQSGVWRGVRPENREHPPLIFVAQMKEGSVEKRVGYAVTYGLMREKSSLPVIMKMTMRMVRNRP